MLSSIAIIWLSISLIIKPIIRNLDNEILLSSKSIAKFIGGSVSFSPLKFISKTIYANNLYLEEQRLLSEAEKISGWNIKSVNHKYKNYVLIIGESMRRDYMSAYGYPIDNTPFLSSVKGIKFNNYVSSAPNTQTSLTRSLYRTENNNIIYSDHVISLAKQANIETIWLSNQGAFGEYDTAASRLGKQADQHFFTKSKSYESSNNFDIELLPELQNRIKEKTDKTRLFIIHIMGSHPIFCERLHGDLTININNNKSLSCYIQSILQTDKLIQDIDSILKETYQPYSVIYFSDHGLSSYDEGKTMGVNNQYKQNYAIPFIQFSSDSQEQTIIDAPRSAFEFMNGFSEWLGIEEEHLVKQPLFYENKPHGKIKVFNWNEMVDFDDLKDDPAVFPQ